MPIKLDVQVASTNADIPEDAQFQLWADSFQLSVETSACLRIVDESEVKTLNLKYRQIDKATNVLSFPAEVPSQVNIKFLGDIVICAPVVVSEAKEQTKNINDHWAHLLIHGLLHLQGYDHIEENDANKMESLEVEILKSLKIGNPYE
ncbi:MAG: rRNA maturation RNase YbeY [Pseudomonadota bacterium]